MSAVSPLTLSATRGYIGGGNIAGILGLSPYRSPLDEFLVITGQHDELTQKREDFFQRRKGLEPWAEKVFARSTGVAIVARNVRYTDDEHAFIKAEIDFETEDGGNGETKTVHPLAARDWGDANSDDLPTYVTAQVMHGLMVTARKFAWVHALIGFDDDRAYRVDRDEETIAAIRRHEVAFWNDHVLPLTPPEPRTTEDLQRMFPRDIGTQIEVDGDSLQAVNMLRDLKSQIKPLEAEAEAVATQIKLAMRDASALTLEGKPVVTWKAQSARRFDQQRFAAAHPELFEQFKTTTEMRVLRVK